MATHEKDIEKNPQIGISRFLNDFATRHIKDEQVEILGIDPVIPPENNDSIVEFSENAQEEMQPLDGQLKTREQILDIENENLELEQPAKQSAVPTIEEMVEEAIEATKKELEDKFLAEKTVLEKSYQKKLQEQENKIVSEIANNMAKELQNIFAQIHQIISKDIAILLVEFIGDKIRQDTLQNFSQEISKKAIDFRKPWVIEGNAKLLDALAKLPDFNEAQFDLRPTELADIRLRLDNMVVATCLESHLTELKELLR